jgi:hypothetical protein
VQSAGKLIRERPGVGWERQKEECAVIKSSIHFTDKLSVMFDWLVDQVPVRPSIGAKGKLLAGTELRKRQDVAGIKEDST